DANSACCASKPDMTVSSMICWSIPSSTVMMMAPDLSIHVFLNGFPTDISAGTIPIHVRTRLRGHDVQFGRSITDSVLREDDRSMSPMCQFKWMDRILFKKLIISRD